MQHEIFLRVVIIVLMACMVIALGSSAYFMSSVASEELLLLHKSAGTLFLIILPMHIYLRREKLKKMFLGLLADISQKELECSNQSHKLIKTLKHRTLKELCQKLNLDTKEIQLLLKEHKVDIQNIEDDLEKISQHNRSDALKIVAIVVEYHIRMLRALEK